MESKVPNTASSLSLSGLCVTPNDRVNRCLEPGVLAADTLVMLADSTFTDRTYRTYPGLPEADTAWSSGTYSVDQHVPPSGIQGSAMVTFRVTVSGNVGGDKRPVADIQNGGVEFWYPAISQLGTNEGTSTPSLYQRTNLTGG